MTSIRWNSEKPLRMTGFDAPTCFRHAAPPVGVCDNGQTVIGWATPHATGMNGRPTGLVRCRTG